MKYRIIQVPQGFVAQFKKYFVWKDLYKQNFSTHDIAQKSIDSFIATRKARRNPRVVSMCGD